MTEFAEITRQAPSIAAVIFIVVIFVRYLEKRDAILQEFMTTITKEMKALTMVINSHAKETTGAIGEMHRTVHRMEDRESDQ